MRQFWLKTNIRKIKLGLLVMLTFFLVYHYQSIHYGIQQAKGQIRILWEARPKSEFLNNPNYPDSLKQKIHLIAEIKKFAIDSLNINPSGSYEKIFDQKGLPILWIVTACPPYSLRAYEWKFPIIGTFSYKGFFEYSEAKKEKQHLVNQGFDARISEVSAWSTLGYLNDPILSEMLQRPVGKLTNLVIHELTHGTLYVKDNVTYNENLANFVGDIGAIRFLNYKYGKYSDELRAYEAYKMDNDAFTNFVLKAGKSLDSLYQSFDSKLSDFQKESLKKHHLQKIIHSIDTCHFINPNYCRYFDDFELNNTFFAGYARYNERRNQFEEEFKNKFNSDFPKYFEYLKNKYPSL